MYFFTADEHYGHKNIIRFCDRPFLSIEEMDRTIIDRNNQMVGNNDTVVHVGDFTLKNTSIAKRYISQLNGNHIFIRGSHDYWLKGTQKLVTMWEKKIEGQYIVACHYAMRHWPRSYHGSWQVHGHAHGGMKSIGLQYDVGVDKNNFYPVSFTKLCSILA